MQAAPPTRVLESTDNDNDLAEKRIEAFAACESLATAIGKEAATDYLFLRLLKGKKHRPKSVLVRKRIETLAAIKADKVAEKAYFKAKKRAAFISAVAAAAAEKEARRDLVIREKQAEIQIKLARKDAKNSSKEAEKLAKEIAKVKKIQQKLKVQQVPLSASKKAKKTKKDRNAPLSASTASVAGLLAKRGKKRSIDNTVEGSTTAGAGRTSSSAAAKKQKTRPVTAIIPVSKAKTKTKASTGIKAGSSTVVHTAATAAALKQMGQKAAAAAAAAAKRSSLGSRLRATVA